MVVVAARIGVGWDSFGVGLVAGRVVSSRGIPKAWGWCVLVVLPLVAPLGAADCRVAARPVGVRVVRWVGRPLVVQAAQLVCRQCWRRVGCFGASSGGRVGWFVAVRRCGVR